jgi:uncharacterized protein YjbJ (UPF0337 family)
MGCVPVFTYRAASTAFVILQEKHQMKPSTRDKAAGMAKNISGSVKEATGKAVGNPRLQAAGKAEKVEGKIQQKVGKIEKTLGC